MAKRRYRIRATPESYKGVQFRSHLEVEWAKHFDQLSLEWQYEPLVVATSLGDYLPDFLVGWPETPRKVRLNVAVDGCHVGAPFELKDVYPNKRPFFVEVKPSRPTTEEITKAADVSVSTAAEFLIVFGHPYNFGAEFFGSKDQEDADFDPLCELLAPERFMEDVDRRAAHVRWELDYLKSRVAKSEETSRSIAERELRLLELVPRRFV